MFEFVLGALAIGCEYYYSQRRGLQNFDWRETKINLFSFLIVAYLTREILPSLFSFAYQYRQFEWNLSLPFVLILSIFIFEFSYYWCHRVCHEMRLGWVLHVMHHTSEHLNFTAALRLTPIGPLTMTWLCMMPFVILGVHPLIFGIASVLNSLYVMFVHTEVVPKLGWWEWIFNSPSHHQVHHSVESQHHGCNYGGVFIIFDRWFGTFKELPVEKKMKYGSGQPVSELGLVGIFLFGWKDFIDDLVRRRSVWVLFERPPSPHEESIPSLQ